MNIQDEQNLTGLLKEIGNGDGNQNVPKKLLEVVYDELRKLANSYLKNERPNHTLQATALVHEAYIRLIDWENVSWQNRAHFFSVAANVMRNILVDYARFKRSQKREGELHKLELDQTVSFSKEKDWDILALEEALNTLEKFDKRQSQIVELRFFGGLSIEETAYLMNISPTTVKREWTLAKAWFQRELIRK